MTTRLLLIISCSLTLWLGAGCGSLNRMQFAIVPPKPGLGMTATLTEADQQMALAVVRQTAERAHLTDRTASSMVPNVLASYQAVDSDNPMHLIVWKEKDRILIDFMHTSEALGESLEFRQARERLLQDLQSAFGSRLQIVPLTSQASPSGS